MGDTPGGKKIGMDEEAVAVTSRKITTAAQDVHALHRTTQGMLDDSGWGHVGSSAKAVNDLSRRWAEAGARHSQHIDSLGRGIGDAGITLSNTNEEGARQIAEIPDY